MRSVELQEMMALSRMKEEIRSINGLASSDTAFFQLPKFLVMQVFDYLGPPDIDAVAQVCRYWNLLVRSIMPLIEFTQSSNSLNL